MNKLIITAHPSTLWFTHKIAEKIEKLSLAKWENVEILNLYTTPLEQNFLKFEIMKDLWENETTKKIQEKITWADELIFIFPIWWWDAPAILKNFIDCNFTAGFAFKYVDGKPNGLLKGKSAHVIATSWAPSFLYKIVLHIQFMWKMGRLGFCWINQKSFTVFGDMENPKTDKNKFLESLEKLV